MKKRLTRISLYTSPILAAYGIAPILLLQSIDVLQFLTAFSLLSLLIVLFWRINIELLNINKPKEYRYLFSYLSTIFIHSFIIFILPKSSAELSPADFILYSLASTFALNTIILIIINSELLRESKNLADYEIQSLKVANLEAQRQALIQQLQPHFLFNALSVLKSLIHDNPEKAEEYTLSLSEFLRYSVHSNQNDIISLEKEWQFTLDYLHLQKVRFGNALKWECNFSDSDKAKFLPVLALQTLVENAIKHNSFTEQKPLLISIGTHDKMIYVKNKKSPKKLLLKSGIGLSNLKTRYQLIVDGGIEVIESDEEFVVRLKLIEK